MIYSSPISHFQTNIFLFQVSILRSFVQQKQIICIRCTVSENPRNKRIIDTVCVCVFPEKKRSFSLIVCVLFLSNQPCGILFFFLLISFIFLLRRVLMIVEVFLIVRLRMMRKNFIWQQFFFLSINIMRGVHRYRSMGGNHFAIPRF